MIKFIKNSVSIWVLLSIFIATSWSLFHPKLFRVHDYIHAARVVEMAQGLADGQIPVRWSQNFGYGYGMPLFSFYAPLPSYLGGFLYLMGFDIGLVVKFLFWFSNIASILGAYWLGKKLWGRSSGLTIAAAFGLFPYRAVNLFVRGAVSESWGMMTYPWILLGVIYFFEKKQIKKWWLVVLSLVFLMLSHNLSTLMFVPVSVIFAFFFGLRKMFEFNQKFSWFWDRFLKLGFAYIWAGLMSAFYMIPAVIEKDLTQIDSILGGYFSYSHHLLYVRQFFKPFWGYGGSQWGVEDGISFFWGYAQILGLFLAIISSVFALKIFLTKFKKTKSLLKFAFLSDLFWPLLLGILLVASSYITLEKSRPIWEALELLSFIQFPWRWLSVVGIIISLLIGWHVSRYQNMFSRGWVGGVIIVLLLGNAYYFRPESYLENSDDFYYTDQALIRKEMSGILPDYIPVDLDLPVEVADQLISDESGFEQVQVLKNVSHEKLFSYQSSLDKFQEVNIAYFSGWRAEVDGVPLEIKSNQGKILLELPAGDHLVTLYFGRTPVRYWSEMISLLAITVFMVSFLNASNDWPESRFYKSIKKFIHVQK